MVQYHAPVKLSNRLVIIMDRDPIAAKDTRLAECSCLTDNKLLSLSLHTRTDLVRRFALSYYYYNRQYTTIINIKICTIGGGGISILVTVSSLDSNI